jgi:uncharacterized ferritin-like protein (DUF455 family)
METFLCPLHTEKVADKIGFIEAAVHCALLGKVTPTPENPGRDISVLRSTLHPPKLGLSKWEGQARMLHDLASIELQAMELAFRTLNEFPEANSEFREELADLTLSEASHLQLCLGRIQELGFQWGHWPVHLGLWSATSAEDSLIDRLLIVHRYLEGSGLDAGETLLRRLSAVDSPGTKVVVQKIFQDEIGHVEFGSRWFRYFCESEGLDPDHYFKSRIITLTDRLPRRLEPVSHRLRLQAGFSPAELDFLEKRRRGG